MGGRGAKPMTSPNTMFPYNTNYYSQPYLNYLPTYGSQVFPSYSAPLYPSATYSPYSPSYSGIYSSQIYPSYPVSTGYQHIVRQYYAPSPVTTYAPVAVPPPPIPQYITPAYQAPLRVINLPPVRLI